MMLPKQVRYRDEAYLDHVRSMACVACPESAPSEPHHFMQGGGGTGRKCDDTFVVPLCRRCHQAWHTERILPCFKPPRFQSGGRELASALSEGLMYRAEARLLAGWFRSRVEAMGCTDVESDIP